jgi:hypothetical protein
VLSQASFLEYSSKARLAGINKLHPVTVHPAKSLTLTLATAVPVELQIFSEFMFAQ